MYNEFLNRRNDPAFANYVQQSNARCNYANQQVCCPSGAAPVTQAPVTQSPVTQSPAPVPSGGGASGGWPAGNPNDYPARLLKPEEGCGYSNETLNRVVGGVPAKLGQWPWMSLIGYKDATGEVGFKCGGSIITKRHILTAAHCIRSDLALVRLGEHDTETDTETQHIEINVISMVKHPKYDKKDGHSDLAILTLERDIPFTSKLLDFRCRITNNIFLSFQFAFRPSVSLLVSPFEARTLKDLCPSWQGGDGPQRAAIPQMFSRSCSYPFWRRPSALKSTRQLES